jgi:hypothetical protein
MSGNLHEAITEFENSYIRLPEVTFHKALIFLMLTQFVLFARSVSTYI